MPYLTCIGGHGVVANNNGGTGARGYWIFRRGTNVIIRYGPVQVCRARTVWIEWLHFKELNERCGSTKKAGERLRQIIHEKTRPEHGYRRLEPGCKNLVRQNLSLSSPRLPPPVFGTLSSFAVPVGLRFTA